MIGLPIIAFLIVTAVDLPPEFEFGLLIISCCPGGPSSNIFAWLARADVALSIALTALSSIVSVMTIPLFLKYSAHYLSFETAAIEIDALKILMRLVFLCLLPFFIGMLLLAQRPDFARWLSGPLRKLGVVLLISLIVMIGFSSYEVLLQSPFKLVASVGVLIVGASGLGMIVSRLSGVSPAQRRTIVIEVAIQNAVQGMVLATLIPRLQPSSLALPSTIYAGFMYVVAGGFVLMARRSSAPVIKS
jgi:BASS family bile acid:Na+ symporter